MVQLNSTASCWTGARNMAEPRLTLMAAGLPLILKDFK
jgi:hypothetical protein